MLNIAIIGATGLVGQAIIEILEEKNFPVKNLLLFASHRSVGESVYFKSKVIKINDLSNFDFNSAEHIDIAFFSAGSKVSAEYAPILAKTGCIVIYNTSHFRYQDDIPLVIPEVNPDDLKDYKKTNIIANPNCATIQALVVLKPLYDLVGIKKINFVTYQSVYGTGRAAVEELAKQTSNALNGRPTESNVYPRQIAFNILPHIDLFQENGYTKEEMKMVWETHKIFHDNSIKITATTAIVPTFYGHSVAIHIETQKPIKYNAII